MTLYLHEHQYLLNISMGTSYSVNKGVDVFDTMTLTQGKYIKSVITYPTGLVENSADAWNPEYYLRTGAELRDFVQLADIPRLHICWDIGHGNVQGCDQYTDILAMGKELHALHVQDNYGDRDSHVMPLVGTTNFDAVLRGLLAADYRGDFTFEGSRTVRHSKCWPHYRRNVTPADRISEPPLHIQQKQIAVMYEIGRWMLESYGIAAE